MYEPEFKSNAFICPHCGAYAQMKWRQLVINAYDKTFNETQIYVVACQFCEMYSLWIEEEFKSTMVYPNKVIAPLPHPDMPDAIKKDFEEARQVAPISPRAACALLRLAVEKLLILLGGKGKSINEDIKNLFEKGLSERTKQAFDIVRITGNNAVHPGVLNEEDIELICNKLFELVNLIIDSTIASDNRIATLYEGLPEGDLVRIEKRDGVVVKEKK